MNVAPATPVAFSWRSLPASVAPAATMLTIGHSTVNPRIAPLWIGQEKGRFEKYGIDATRHIPS